MSGADAAAGAWPAQAAAAVTSTVPLSKAATNRLRVIYGSFRVLTVDIEVG